ncbi:alpha/beta hydrolase [Escherichia coli]
MINRLMWIWRGIDDVKSSRQARIVMSDAERTDDDIRYCDWLPWWQLDL